MTPQRIVLLVVGILALQVLVWIPIIVVLKRKSARLLSEIRATIESAGERVIREPRSAVYRGATDGYSRVSGNGVLALTDRRLIFRKLVGESFEIPRDRIVGAREDKWFTTGYGGGRMHLILKTTEGHEVGFIVNDHAAWMSEFPRVANAS